MRIQRFALCMLVFSAGLCCTALDVAQAKTRTQSPPPEGLTLEAALAQASRNRPELTVYQADLEAAMLKLQHAGLPPNPEIGVEWNNLGNDLPDGDTRETTVSLSQALEIGGKPSARKNKGQAEMLRLQREQAMTWLDIAAEVRTAFVEVLNARERLALQREAGKIASEMVAMTHEQVMAGKIAGTEETRAQARNAEALAETQKLKRLLTEAELNLATVLLADPGNATVTAAGSLSHEVPVPDRQALLAEMKDSPLLALRRSETQLAKTSHSLEQANAWSDPTLSLSVRDVPSEDARAFAIGVSIPLPLFQRNQTSLAEAGALAHKARANEAAASRRLETELIKAHAVLVAADQEVRMLRADGLSKAAEAAEAVQEGFRAGKFRYSDLLEATQSLAAMKARYLDALLDLNRAAIALDRLLGKPALPALSKNFSSPSTNRSTP